jgi:Zn-dependent peptidase ImmA (M78 family)
MREQKPSKVVAAGAAIKLWKLYRFPSARELIIEDLALALGVIVIEDRLDTAEARLVRQGPRGLIRVNQLIPERGRKRFAIAHELGHWILHRDISQINACTDSDMIERYKASAPEVEASSFAAELLMPQAAFIPYLRRVRPSFRLISELATEFDTSLTATAIRCVEVTDDYWALVVSEAGRIRWWRGSERFEERFWIDTGTALAMGTVAGSLLRGKSAPSAPEEVRSSDWVDCKDGYGHDTLIEEVFPLSDRDQILSLLYLP